MVNLLHKKDKAIIGFSILLAIILPLIPILANYGLHYFGGHVPLIDRPDLLGLLPEALANSPLSSLHPGILYSFGPLQQIFIFILGMVAFFAIFSALSETKRPSGVYMFLMFMGTAAVTALLLSDDIFHMYVFFEIAALTQVGIIVSSKTDHAYETALKYMILGSIGGPILLLGIGFLLAMAGSVNITDIVFAVKNGLINPLSPVFLLAFGLIFFGWSYASGLPPFHTIKSAVYSKALPHGSALLQAFTVITFISFAIAILRIFSTISFTYIVIMVFSIAAMLLGITMAIMQDDFRRMLGYLAVGELGYIGIGLSLGTAMGITAGLFQALNEILITAMIFLGFGATVYLTKTSKISNLGGLISQNPKIAISLLIGGLVMAGVPPFNIFQSKLMLIQSALNSGFPELAFIMVLMSIVTFMTFTKAFYSVFLKPKDLDISPSNVPTATVISIGALLIICIILGLFPQIATVPINEFVVGVFGV
ncbi:MAG: energy conserving hydrogenase EhbF [Methanobacteriaceae archaeon]